VLPAVVQVVAAVTVAEGLLGRPLPLEGVDHAKFRLLVEPGEEVAVHCARRPGGGRPVVSARVLVDRGLASDFRLTFGEQELP
jgi:3-hydroxymyristoyl/3-hydroxydecanoyl-(acyl carrier protein) dehydratase